MSARAVADQLGHSNITSTLNVYGRTQCRHSTSKRPRAALVASWVDRATSARSAKAHDESALGSQGSVGLSPNAGRAVGPSGYISRADACD